VYTVKVHRRRASEHPDGAGITLMIPIAKLPPEKKKKARRRRSR
jgi:hypothetical protein